jgi:hypothetical protein
MWIKNRTIPESLEFLGKLSKTCSELGGPLTQELYALVLNKDFKAIIDFTFDYGIERPTGSKVNDVLYARQIQALYSKSEFLNIGVSRCGVALSAFLAAEATCAETNRRLKRLAKNPSLMDSALHGVFHHAQRKISRILGDVPSLSELKVAFGPGATTSVSGAFSCPRAKLSSRFECSSNTSPTVALLLEEIPAWVANQCVQDSSDSWIASVSVVPGKLGFVPKNAKTDRTIVVEPILNGLFQKGLGSFMKGRLAKAGVNLRSQTRNQGLACKGSQVGSVATVDLTMASDTLSAELVKHMLPFDWFNLLDSLRTPEITLGSSEDALTLEKFSSMGNGFTFELESLIFYSLAFGVCSYLGLSTVDVSTYGDDIIIPTEAYTLLESALGFAGFSVNEKKSFSTGYFRESCGADYYNGFDIRPFYQKDLVSDRTLYSAHNWFVRHGELALARCCLNHIEFPDEILYGPDGYGDGHLIGDFRIRRNRAIVRSGWDGGVFDTYSLKQRINKTPLPGDAVLPTYSVYTRSGELDSTNPDVVRGSRGYSKISIYTLERNIFHS